jgi:hypothetical protein
MENDSDTQIQKKEVVKKCMTIVYALSGLAAAPIVFLLAFPKASDYMPWLASNEQINYLHVWLTFFGALVIAVVWSVFAAAGWRRGNVGIRIGLTAVIWALAVAVVLVVFGRLVLESL